MAWKREGRGVNGEREGKQILNYKEVYIRKKKMKKGVQGKEENGEKE